MVSKEDRSFPCTREIITGLSASASGTVHSIGTATPSVVYLLVVTVSPDFGAVILKTLSSCACIREAHSDRKQIATKVNIVSRRAGHCDDYEREKRATREHKGSPAGG